MTLSNNEKLSVRQALIRKLSGVASSTRAERVADQQAYSCGFTRYDSTAGSHRVTREGHAFLKATSRDNSELLRTVYAAGKMARAAKTTSGVQREALIEHLLETLIDATRDGAADKEPPHAA